MAKVSRPIKAFTDGGEHDRTAQPKTTPAELRAARERFAKDTAAIRDFELGLADEPLSVFRPFGHAR